jgi:ribonuclease E
MNQKRDYVASIESNYGLSVRVEADLNLVSPEYSIEKLKSATRIVNESEPELVTADGLMEVSEEDMNEDLNDEDEKPKKRRRRRRKKKQFSTEEGADANLDNTENRDSLESASTETSSSGENLGSEKGTNQRKRRKKGDNLTTVSSGLAEDFSEVEGDKIKEEDIADKNSVDVDPEEKSNLELPIDAKEKKKPTPKKRIKKEIIADNNGDDQEDNTDNSKQKRKGWWSLKS